MGIFSNSVSICQFCIVGTPPKDLPEWAATSLARQGFRSIEEGCEEQSIGWVQIDDPELSDFAGPHTFQYDHYLAFSLRRDQRKLPATMVKAYRKRAEQEFLAAHPDLRRVPKQKREDLADAVRGMLLARTLPVPAVCDVVWDTRNQLVTLASLNGKVIELFVDLFKQTFDGLKLTPLHPYARAGRIASGPLEEPLRQANRSTSEAVLDLIEANNWLGRDFLFWLTHETLHGSGDFSVSQPGPALAGEGFVAYINDRLQLLATSESGQQKVTVSGPQQDFSEVRTALHDGKEILEAVIYLEKQEQVWKTALKGDLFHFSSFKAPPVTLEKDELTDPAMERQAVFFERMGLLEEGLQLFDSLLESFLKIRLAGDWPAREQQIRKWMSEG
ncbi:MAG: exonuclease [Desulfuromonas sp.]|nr:MAG: exonuclease [Desulfuromonas sp.]